jgi:hypothetical protein
MRRLDILHLSCAVLLALTLAACRGPEVPHAMTGTTRYLCCNFYYERTKVNDAAWQVGTKVPLGTRVRIERVRRGSIDFTPEGYPTITLVYKYSARSLPFDAYLDRLFVEHDPRARLRKLSAKRVGVIENGIVEQGMTKDQVLMARGIPPAHRTPSLESPMWTYWRNKWDTMEVYFVNDKVERVVN